MCGLHLASCIDWIMKFLVILLVSAVYFHVLCDGKQSTVNLTPSASDRAQQTLNGLMDYYWNHDPNNKNISFFFACGQIGGLGSGQNECSCNNPSACVSCYRWWDAVALESLATFGIYTNTSNHSDVPDTIFQHSPYNANWDGANTFTYVDDFAWYGMAYLRVYEWLNVSNKIVWHCSTT